MVDCGRYEPLHSAWVDGELNRGERADMAAHLQVCGRCRSRINGLRVTAAMVASLPPRQMPDGLLGDIGTPAAVAGTVRHHPSAAAVRRGVTRSLAGVAAAVALVAVAAFAAGGRASDGERVVAVPVDVFVADHLVHTVGGPVSTPVLLEGHQP